MMKKVKVLSLLAATMLSTSAFAQENTIKIGGIFALTGVAAQIATAASDAIQYEADKVNAAGGLEVKGKKYKIEYIPYDDQLKPAETVAAYTRFADKEGGKYVFSMISASHLAIKQKIEDDDMFGLTSAVSDKAIEADTKHAVRIQPRYADVLPGMIKWLKANAKGDKFVRIYPNDESGRLFESVLDPILKANGYKASTEFVERQAKDFAPVITKIMANPPDFIDMGPTSPATSALIVRQARELGYKGQFVLTGGSGQQAILETVGPQGAEGLVHLLFADPANKGFQDLAAHYKKKYGSDPNEVGVFFADGAATLFKAIQLGGDPSKPQLARAEYPKVFPFKSLQGDTLTFGGKSTLGVDAQVFAPNYIAVMENGKSVVKGNTSEVK